MVVIMETDTGHIGYGSAPAAAVITGETHGSIIEAINKVISPVLMGRDIEDLNNLTDSIQCSISKVRQQITGCRKKPADDWKPAKQRYRCQGR